MGIPPRRHSIIHGWQSSFQLISTPLFPCCSAAIAYFPPLSSRSFISFIQLTVQLYFYSHFTVSGQLNPAFDVQTLSACVFVALIEGNGHAQCGKPSDVSLTERMRGGPFVAQADFRTLQSLAQSACVLYHTLEWSHFKSSTVHISDASRAFDPPPIYEP